MRRDGLRDDQWDRIKDLLPGREGRAGGTAKDNRLFIEAVLYGFRTGCRMVKILDRIFGAFGIGPPFDPPFRFFAEEPVDRTRKICCCRR
jgi:transposase